MKDAMNKPRGSNAKRNLRKIPGPILADLRTLPRQVAAGCARTFTAEALRAGALRHLSVSLVGGRLVLPEGGSVVPPSALGKYSMRNREGYVVVRTDLPKETHYVTVEAPNWGNAARYGTHPVDLPHPRYPRDEFPPRLNSIRVRAVSARRGLKHYAFVFEVDEVLDQRARGFRERLLDGLNLLQENVGSCGVQRSNATVADYVATLAVDWEILPPGTREETLARIFKGKKPTPQEVDTAGDRYAFFQRLKPQKLVFGASGFQRYFGAMIRSDLVVFENLAYGNAVYIMFRNWKKLSRMNRVDLLRGRDQKDFERVVHTRGWKTHVEQIVLGHLPKPPESGSSL